jgi:hypothetical protein
VPFIGWGMERSGREASGQVVAGGAPLTRWLLEDEATRRAFDEGEVKGRQRHVGSFALRVSWVFVGAAVASGTR